MKFSFVVLGIIFVVVASRTIRNAESFDEDVKQKIHGAYSCNRKRQSGQYLELSYEESPDVVIANTTSGPGGDFEIVLEEDDKALVLVIRHQCPVTGIELPKNCTFPYYLTTRRFKEQPRRSKRVAYSYTAMEYIGLEYQKNNTKTTCLD